MGLYAEHHSQYHIFALILYYYLVSCFPCQRKRRATGRVYDSINLTQYEDENARVFNELDTTNDFNGTKDQRTLIDDLFSTLYLNIPK